jgi:hypothetical protein
MRKDPTRLFLARPGIPTFLNPATVARSTVYCRDYCIFTTNIFFLIIRYFSAISTEVLLQFLAVNNFFLPLYILAFWRNFFSLIVFGGTEVPIIYIFLCRPSEDSLQEFSAIWQQ